MISRWRGVVCLFALLLAGVAQAATNPWYGVWRLRLEHPGQTPETLVYSDAGGGAMRMVSVEDKRVIVTRFDGKFAADEGEASSQGWALAVRIISPTSYGWTVAKGGQPRAQGVNTLAADLKTFKEVSWAIGRTDKTMTVTYERR